MKRRDLGAVAALGFILAVSVAWWAAALWPLPAETPEWVARARAACFGSTESGLPDAGGWILLIGSPISMVAALLIIAGSAVRDGLRALLGASGGRVVVAAGALVLLVGIAAAVARVSSAYGLGRVESAAASPAFDPSAMLERLDRAAPPLALVDQHGERTDLERFRGRPVLLTFAYGRCETVCPVIVHNTIEARNELTDVDPVILVVTLDPWRDTPSRLPHIARSWQLPADAHLLGGEVAEVEAALDAWQVPRSRDLQTGEIAHPSLVYVIDADGRIAFAVTGSREHIVQATRRL